MNLLLCDTQEIAERHRRNYDMGPDKGWLCKSITSGLCGHRFENIIVLENWGHPAYDSDKWRQARDYYISQVLPTKLKRGGNIFYAKDPAPGYEYSLDDILTQCNIARHKPEAEATSTERRMNYSTSVLLVNENIRTVKGLYEEHGKPEIFKTVDKDIKVDDFAVVESGTRWNLTTVKITAVDVTDEVDFDSSCQMKWVVGKIGKDDHDKLKAMEKQLMDVMKVGELRKRREDIKRNVLDAKTAGELGSLPIAQLGGPAKVDAA